MVLKLNVCKMYKTFAKITYSKIGFYTFMMVFKIMVIKNILYKILWLC